MKKTKYNRKHMATTSKKMFIRGIDYPTTRDELLTEAQRMSEAGSSQDEVIQYIRRVANYYGIRMRHDSLDIPAAVPEHEIQDTRKSKKGKDNSKKIPVTLVRSDEGSYTLKLDMTGIFPKNIISRVILSSDKRSSMMHSRKVPLFYECNGLVIDANTWRALAIPPFAFNHRISTKIVEDNLNDGLYDIIKVDDGTVITLYNWNHPTEGPIWSLSSSNGYDVSGLYWIGTLSYAEIFHDLACRIYPEFVAKTGMTIENSRLAFTNLDANHCYTFGFRHHNFHPMKCDPERLWQIQVADLSKETPMVRFCGVEAPADSSAPVELPHIPNQYLIPNLEIYPLLISEQRLKFDKFKSIFAESIRNASDHARAFHKEIAPPAEPLNYGYILRSRDPSRTKEYSDLLIESPLLIKIRKISYERAPRQLKNKLDYNTRREFNALRSYLTINERDEFIMLYPEWTTQFHVYTEFINNIKDQIIRIGRNAAMAPVTQESHTNTYTAKIARILSDNIIGSEGIPAFHELKDSIISDYIVDPQYTFLYMRVMQMIKEKSTALKAAAAVVSDATATAVVADTTVVDEVDNTNSVADATDNANTTTAKVSKAAKTSKASKTGKAVKTAK
jgi:hypothetical protein